MVLVFGFNNVQRAEIEKRHRNVVTADKTRPLPLLKTVDRVILTTKFISHEMQHRAMRLYGRDNVSLVWGGITAVSRAVGHRA